MNKIYEDVIYIGKNTKSFKNGNRYKVLSTEHPKLKFISHIVDECGIGKWIANNLILPINEYRRLQINKVL